MVNLMARTESQRGGANHRAAPTIEFERELVEMTRRLIARFDDWISPSVVAATVRQCADRLTGARVAEFVPLLTERHATEQLRSLRDQRMRAGG